jgi:hypothetical protein
VGSKREGETGESQGGGGRVAGDQPRDGWLQVCPEPFAGELVVQCKPCRKGASIGWNVLAAVSRARIRAVRSAGRFDGERGLRRVL